MILRAEGKPQMKRFKPLKFPKMINYTQEYRKCQDGAKKGLILDVLFYSTSTQDFEANGTRSNTAPH